MIVTGYEYAVNKIGKKKLYQKEKLINLGGELFFSEKEKYGILDKTNPHSIYDLMLYDFMPKYKSMTYKRLKFLLCESIKLFGILQEPWIQEKYNLISGTTRIIYNYSTNISEMSTMSKDNFHIHINTISILDFRTNGLIKKEFTIDNSIFEMSVLLYNELKNDKNTNLDILSMNIGEKDTPLGVVIVTKYTLNYVDISKLTKYLLKIHKIVGKFSEEYEKKNKLKSEGSNYSLTIYFDNEGQLCINVVCKRNSLNGGASDTFFIDNGEFLSVKRNSSYFDDNRVKLRREFQDDIVNEYLKIKD
ncbi:hypothetical protein [Streptococcus agalactiae]|uniref:hypothetical protein n=3 Tax=Streptococcus agalactiae TaxID=1311 RepID=UPI00085CB779|nr:hypothetical protein [Streptococcus agalactiae]